MAKPLWRWRGMTPQGAPRAGAVWAESRAGALLILQADGIVPLALRRCRVKRALWQGQHGEALVRQLATLLQAGLTLSEGLSLLADQHPHPQWRALLAKLSGELARGRAFSDALGEWPEVFSPLYISMIQAGEMTGRLDICCQHLARQQEGARLLAQKVRKALRYPAIILALALAVTLGMSGFVLPEFAAIYRTFNAPLPALTRGVIAFSDGVQRGWPWLTAIAGSALLLRPLLLRSRRWKMLWPQIALAIPVFSDLLRGQKLSQIYTVLALTQRAGIPFLQGLENVARTLTCPWWRKLLGEMAAAINRGSTICQALEASPVFTPLCRQLIRTGEASGALDTMLENLADYHTQRTHQQAESLASLLEPIMLLVTGVIIGTLVVAMYLPIFNLGDALGNG